MLTMTKFERLAKKSLDDDFSFWWPIQDISLKLLARAPANLIFIRILSQKEKGNLKQRSLSTCILEKK